MKKAKLSIEQQVEYMEQQGIQFNLVSKIEAKDFLTYNTYYFKLKAYAKNFRKDSSGKYIGLEFAYLQDLSTIDMHFRKIILSICLQIEHALKVTINRHFCNNDLEDGYNIVRKFSSSGRYIKKDPVTNINDFINNKHSYYTGDIIDKYKTDFALWNLIEILSFGELVDFYKTYTYHYGRIINSPLSKKIKYNSMLFVTKQLRNACAHNNCLINNIDKQVKYKSKDISSLLSKCKSISISSRKTMLNKQIVNDFVTLLCCFEATEISNPVRWHSYSELYGFINRCMKHKEYYIKNSTVSSLFEFFQKTVDFFYNKEYNNVVAQKS